MGQRRVGERAAQRGRVLDQLVQGLGILVDAARAQRLAAEGAVRKQTESQVRRDRGPWGLERFFL